MAGLRWRVPPPFSFGLVVNPATFRGMLATSTPFPNSLHPWRNPLGSLPLGSSAPASLLDWAAFPSPFPSGLFSNSGGLQFHGLPNPPLNSDPACIAFRSLSTSRYLGSVHRLGAGGAG